MKNERGINYMAIHNKSHSNHALMSLNKMRKDNNWKQKSAADFEKRLLLRFAFHYIQHADFHFCQTKGRKNFAAQ